MFNVPPWISAPTSWTTAELPLAVIFPPLLFTVFWICRIPLAVASSSPAFVTPPEPFSTSTLRKLPPAELASIRSASLIDERQTAVADNPVALDRIVRIGQSSTIAFYKSGSPTADAVELSVTVPPPAPWSVVFPIRLSAVLVALPPFSWKLPLLLIVPRMLVVLLKSLV